MSLVKVYVDFAGRSSDVDYLNMVGEPQQGQAGSQRAVDCSRECGVRDGAGLCILKKLLLLLFDGSDGAVRTQHVPQRVGQACRALAEAVPDCIRGLSASLIKTQHCLSPSTYLIIASLAVKEFLLCRLTQQVLPDPTHRWWL
jgi:hypothetical protein